jgi:signal peptidase I
MNGAIVTAGPPLWVRLIVGRHPRRTIIRLGVLVLLSFIVFRFVLIPIRVTGLSMYPTYKDGRISVVNHWAYRWKKPQRGDIVAVRVPEENNVLIVKRVVGLPGERVRVRKGKVYIDGELLQEPYAKVKAGQSTGRDVPLGKDECFVIGDNRDISMMDRVFEGYILGKVLF